MCKTSQTKANTVLGIGASAAMRLIHAFVVLAWADHLLYLENRTCRALALRVGPARWLGERIR